MSNSLLISNVRPGGQAKVDVLVVDGLIQKIGPGLRPPTPDTQVLDGANQLLIPGLVDGHAHLDKTLWGQPWHSHRAGPNLSDKIENERRLRLEQKLSPHLQSARGARQAISRGTTHIRSHVDIDTESGLANFEGVQATQAELKASLDMQIVAFPQSGLLIRPGTLELVEEAVKQGAAVIGGLDPAGIDRDPAGQLKAIFGLAERYGVEIDIHLHDPGDLGAFQVELIAERTRSLGLQGRVAISHVFCLGMVGEKRLQGLIELLVENRIAIMTHGPGNSPFPPILRLKEAGVRLFTGSDGVRDAWGPFGNSDMLERAWILSYRSNFRKDEELEIALDLATFGGAGVFGAQGYGLEVGCQADLVVLPGETLAEAIINRAPRKYVIKQGRLVVSEGRCLI
jgi:cytosine/adenosine deaminase-related metal-dependent hydrolase